jgi:hypothetical protein
MSEEQAGEQERNKGRWTKGTSGNPAGRPKGSRNRTTALCADLLSDHAESVMEQCITMAKQGDGVALKLCVDRLIPARAARDRTVDVALPDVGAVQDLAVAAAAVIEHAAAGRITLSEAKEFMHLLEVQRKLVETAELAVRIEALEGAAVEQRVRRDLDGLAPDLRARVRMLDPRERGNVE